MIEVLVGMIASGKSTYARRRADEGAIIISHDDLTEMLHARYRYESRLREMYRRMEESLAWLALDNGRDVIIDRTHLTSESRDRWVKWAKVYNSLSTYGYRKPPIIVIAVAFPIEAPEVHARRRMNDHRARPYEEWLLIARHHVEQARLEPLSDDEGFSEVRHETGQE